jgi:ligand-binding sensor domain-containing protein/two-component sensor histidine kinase
MIIRNFFFILIIFLCVSAQEFFQNYDIKQFSVVNGLSHQSITKIIQDKEGFIWIGTIAGLNKFDGYQFRAFQHKAFDKSSISNNYITDIYEDSENTLWFATAHGLNRFNKSEQTFKIYFQDLKSDEAISGNYIYSICEDRDGLIWVVTSNGISIYNRKTDSFRDYYQDRLDLLEISREANTVFCDSNKVWIGTRKGLFYFNLDDYSIYRYESINSDYESISSNIISTIYKDSKKHLWIGTILGLNQFNISTNKIKKFYYNITDNSTLNSDYITEITENENGNLWVGTAFGLNYYLESSETFFDLSPFFKSKNLASSLNISALMEDKSNNLWVGTESFGLFQLYQFKKAFNILEHNPSTNLSLSSNSVTAINIDQDGNWWIGTNWGLNRYQPSPEKMERFYQNFDSKYELTNDFITSIEIDPNNKIWVGTLGGLDIIDQKRDTIIHMDQFENNSFLKNKNINSLKLIGTNIWVALGDAVVTIDFQTLKVKNVSKLDGFHIKKMVKHGDNIWLSIKDNGLLRYNMKDNQVKVYTHNPNKIGTISSNDVNCLYTDRVGSLWIGTGSGLNRYNESTDEFRLFEELNKYTSDYVLSILEDAQGYYWITSNRGLSRLELNEDEIISLKNFVKEDGVDLSLFKAVNYKYGDDLLFFGSNQGLLYFNSSDISLSDYEPEIKLNKIQTNKRVYYHFPKNEALKFDSDEKFINVYFVSMDYTKPEHNQFAYRLLGYSDEWKNLANQHSITFNNMGSGNYLLEVKGTNSDNLWSKQTLKLDFIIASPFYERWWFILLVLLLILQFALFIYKIRKRKINEIRSIRSRIARDLHDDIGASLTEITLMSEMTKVVKDINKRNEFLGKIEDISRTLVSSLGDLVWSIDVNNDRFSDLLEKMKDFAGNILSVKDIKIHYKISGMDLTDRIDQHIKQTIYLIFKEAINNIVKHSKANAVTVELDNKNERFIMRISDNGQGLDLEQEQKGNGLNNMKIRAKRIKALIDFKVKNGLIIELETKSLG